MATLRGKDGKRFTPKATYTPSRDDPEMETVGEIDQA